MSNTAATEVRTSRHQFIRVVRVEDGWVATFAVFTNRGVAPLDDLNDVRNWDDRQRVFLLAATATSFVGHYLTTDPGKLATETECTEAEQTVVAQEPATGASDASD